ncbi:HNH endonuclease [Pseudooceanicola atlanticus]|uniref:HNH endonuclease n=1 Tax=Pseudooceanicola atlanticus TaxID=1461694 RepID=UPI003B5B91D0
MKEPFFSEQELRECFSLAIRHGGTLSIDLVEQTLVVTPKRSKPKASVLRNRNIPANIRAETKQHDGDVCVYCGSTNGPFEIDHIHPFSKGGRHTRGNLAVACKPCNLSKRDKTLEEWRGRNK